MHSTPGLPSTTCGTVVLAACTEADLDCLLSTRETLTRFEVKAERMLLGVSDGENPDFAQLAVQAGAIGARIVIAAIRESRLTRSLAAALTIPLIRVPVPSDASPAAALSTLMDAGGDGTSDAPGGVDGGSFATVALGEAGAKNAGLLAVSILALTDERLRAAWQAFRDEQTQAVLSQPPPSG